MSEIKILGEFKCPICKGEKRALTVAHKALKERGLEEPQTLCWREREVVPLLDMNKAVLSMPVITFYTDYCLGCGSPYVFRIDTQDAPIQFTGNPAGKN